jgi:hypothetical protein
MRTVGRRAVKASFLLRDGLQAFSGKLVRLMLWSNSGELARLMQTKRDTGRGYPTRL